VVRLLDSVVAALSRAHLLMVHSFERGEPTQSGRVAAQLVRVDPLRRCAPVAKEYPEEALGSICMPLLLKENIKRGTVLVDGTPQPMLLSSDPHRHLIQMPHAPRPCLPPA
jgi:hypothetical protein